MTGVHEPTDDTSGVRSEPGRHDRDGNRTRGVKVGDSTLKDGTPVVLTRIGSEDKWTDTSTPYQPSLFRCRDQLTSVRVVQVYCLEGLRWTYDSTRGRSSSRTRLLPPDLPPLISISGTFGPSTRYYMDNTGRTGLESERPTYRLWVSGGPMSFCVYGVRRGPESTLVTKTPIKPVDRSSYGVFSGMARRSHRYS